MPASLKLGGILCNQCNMYTMQYTVASKTMHDVTNHLLLLLQLLFPKAEEKKALAEEKAKEIEEQNKVISVEKKEAESSLAEALPALEAARNALQDLEKSDVTEIR